MPRKLSPLALLGMIALVAIAAVDLFPLAYMAALSARGGLGEHGAGDPVWLGPWIRLYRSAPLFPRWFFNSALVTTLTVLFHLLADSMAAFVLAKGKFRGRGAVFALVILAMMVPRQVTLIPLFLRMGRLGLADTFWGLLLPGLGDVVGVFLIRQFLVTIPDSLLEAARIDGAGQWGVFFHVIMPLARPALAVLAVLASLHYWSDFFWPLVITTSEPHFTVQVGLAYLVRSEDFGPDLPLMAAGACAAALPPLVFFLLLRGAFFEGLRAGAVK